MPMKERLRVSFRAFWALLMPVIIIGGMKTGIFTPTEAAVVAAADAGSEIATIVQHCGLRVEPESAAGFVQAIITLCDDDTRRLDLGVTARVLAESTLGVEAVLNRLDAELQALVGSAGHATAAQPPAHPQPQP